MNESPAAKLIIISGPSGAGKSTVTKRLLSECELPLRMSVSATTRQPRPGEIPGKAYHFVSQAEFDKLRQENAFLECKEVFGRGHWYGTLRSEVVEGIKAGEWVILEIDVQGALDVMQHPDLEHISLFIHPGSMEELERRLRDRGTESEQAIERRMETAAGEMRFLHEYQYEIINGSVDAAVAQVCRILKDHQENQVCSKS
ncbi:guanylate kinase [Roseiconus lacunae]|uniref:Guanylate kinase n=1 Tax=Roseiconus lacunae TaxID=2605694 RepID=A0ABT7PBR9_9BACT|nr:guanylate kinase [Roseiconus lacunae]MCD0462108.1 guanylate kinase [Roseiconus lacunae]MDM4013935.1 guanylate kinase [Roseiconus lacunae]WRQ53231.1 guanylate kinase [Stieleria sp. HD01]